MIVIYFFQCFVSFIWPKITIESGKKVRERSSEDAVARKWRMQQRYKKVRFFTCPKTFSTWTGFGFSLHDDDKKEEEEEVKEE